jgi:hypothetical protein
MIEGLNDLKAMFDRIPARAMALMADAVDESADEFVSAVQQACPTSDLEGHPGELRESIHKKPGDDALQKYVVADAKDAKGNYYGVHVETGHKTPDGKHVPAYPFWWPTWRLTRKRIRSRINRAFDAAMKEIAGG